MPKFRKKPVVIEALQWDGSAEGAITIINWVVGADGVARYHDEPWGTMPDTLHIDTLEGTMRAQAGDWIIKGVQGEFYPCKPDIFESTYESYEEVPV
jgi:hypothetical protein